MTVYLYWQNSHCIIQLSWVKSQLFLMKHQILKQHSNDIWCILHLTLWGIFSMLMFKNYNPNTSQLKPASVVHPSIFISIHLLQCSMPSSILITCPFTWRPMRIQLDQPLISYLTHDASQISGLADHLWILIYLIYMTNSTSNILL